MDTHVWLWWIQGADRLRPDVKDLLQDATTLRHLSSASVWETLILARKGKLTLQRSPREFVLDGLRRMPHESLPITVSVALRSEALAGLSTDDPADRFLVATALEHDLTLVTADAALLAYEPLDTLAA